MVKQQLCRLLRPAWIAVLSTFTLAAAAQTPAVRLSGAITGPSSSVLAGSRPPLAALSTDAGVLPSGTAVKGMTLVFARSAAQEADLQALLAAQADPGSPQYHQWLTPDSFGARFGLSDADLGTVEAWLQGQGFSVDGVNRSRNAVSFSGSAGLVASAFATELHRYKLGGETHFAPSTDLSLPAALAPMVTAVLHTADFRPRADVRMGKAQTPAPDYTSSQSGAHYLTPKDVATMYNVQAEYSAGFTGVGQSIAVVGESYVQTADVNAFQTAAGLPTNTPSLVLVPNSGVSAVSSGDEGESDLDLEYASGMAPGATVYLVYTGNNANYSVFDALNYAITENIAPVVSISYGECEPLVAAATATAYNAYYAQAAAQGQSIFASAGDSGSESCYGFTGQTTAVQEQLAVNFPASSPYVTAVGGTQMGMGASTSSTYWAAASGTDVASSLLSYVPEVVWNEDSTSFGIAAGGGGASILFSRPTWQAGVTGIPSGTARLVPDVALLSAINNPGFVYCSSDLDDLQDEDLTSSCRTGFRDSSGKYLLVAGGTSFATPIMAGMTALLNQVKHATGQGLLNPQLYTLAASATTYGSAFHDITSGTNACTIATTTTASYCSTAGASGYAATAGYDEATGLGSVNFANLVSAWPSTSATALPATITTLAAASATPLAGAADLITINVANATSGSTVAPTGSVAISVDGGTAVPVALGTTATGNAGVATYSYTAAATGGSHVITATYSGDTVHAPSKGTTAVTITAGTVATGTFSFTVGAVSSASGSTGSSAVSIVPGSNYNGTVVFTLTVPSGAPVVCYEMEDQGYPTYAIPVSGVTAATLVLGVGTSECGSASTSPFMRPAVRGAAGSVPGGVSGSTAKASLAPSPAKPWQGKPAAAVFAGLLLTGFAARRRARRLPTLLSLALLAVLGAGLSGCSGSGTGTGETTTAPPATAAASYTLTLVGTDSVTSAITSSTTFTLTVP